MTRDDAEVLSLLIHHLGLADVILDEHVADPTGQWCVRCSRSRQIPHPCPLRWYANEAKSLDQ